MAFLSHRQAQSPFLLAFAGLLLLTLPAAAQSSPAANPAGNTTATPTQTHAQTQAQTQAQTKAQTKPVPHRVAPHYRKRKRHVVKAAEPPAAPPPPPPPVPPAQQPARPAQIQFSQGRLSIDADNASLVDILNRLSHQTGMAVDGLNGDKRIYGQYGPGPMADTLSQLLDGAGYNYVIIGGGPGQTPTKLLLTTPSNAPATPAAPAAASTPAPVAANPSEPVEPKTPQQIFDELRRMHHPH